MSYEISFSKGGDWAPDDVTVGDSGIYLLHQIGGPWQLHYMPDGNFNKVVGREREYATRFIRGFNGLVEWWRSGENIFSATEWECSSNPIQWNFMKKNYGDAFQIAEVDRPSGLIVGRIYPQLAQLAKIR